jgi:hypothetical protein
MLSFQKCFRQKIGKRVGGFDSKYRYLMMLAAKKIWATFFHG